ncbi:serine--tRNA ligase [Caulobacter sp. KR2-114]|uniref:serine--tRNA ligase n=1 Tax=Caulobacter sp. KR2-114 TaxID=3400912 RepID=UPI003C016359
MHDIRAIRDNPEAYDTAWARRGLSAQTPAILALDGELRAAQTALQAAQSRRNDASKLIGMAKAKKDEAEASRLMAEVEALKGEMAAQSEVEARVAPQLRDLLSALPNLPADGVPDGADEHDNVEVRRYGEPYALERVQDHVDLGVGMGMADFEAAARMSGARFTVLKSQLARLERALGQFMLDVQTQEHGYTEISPPLLVRDEAVYGTGQLPKFAEDLFHTTDGRWLIPTAEVSLTNLVREQITPEEELPLRLTALTPCFRSEAGASGKDTRGMIRQHQFWKVELVAITTPDDSDAEHERMVQSAESILKRLELPFRTMALCTGDMGFSARRTFDLEVWLPSQATYREISSISNCGDFQARRMDARCKKAGEKGTRFVHTLNGSGLAVGRTLVAVMENYQDEKGRIAIPQALHPYMRGMTHVGGEG